ncbi:histidine triad nucleotide-binding protein [Candidatus Dependentiae bacterium]|nr:histidine triad nucleotide-binding protein [Candidatus Dependentiae bacterium]
MKNCIFCKIIKGEIETDFLFENERIIALKDIHPAAPVHILIIPKTHIETINEVDDTNYAVVGEMIMTAKLLASQYGLTEPGYRLVFNCNKDAGQEVFHIHLHLLGGRPFKWPPG